MDVLSKNRDSWGTGSDLREILQRRSHRLKVERPDRDRHARLWQKRGPKVRVRAADVLNVLAGLLLLHRPPEHSRSDDGPELAGRRRVLTRLSTGAVE